MQQNSNNITNKNCIVNYYGPCSMQVVSSLGKFITDNISSKPTARTKLYKVLIELTFNVLKYSSEVFITPDNCNVGVGLLNISDDENYYYCQTKNKILTEQITKLKENCEMVNALDHLDLRHKKEQLRKSASLLDTGAHIGLISIKLFSENQIDYDFLTDNNNDTFFVITTRIDK
jgi:hypothetical protein